MNFAEKTTKLALALRLAPRETLAETVVSMAEVIVALRDGKLEMPPPNCDVADIASQFLLIAAANNIERAAKQLNKMAADEAEPTATPEAAMSAEVAMRDAILKAGGSLQ